MTRLGTVISGNGKVIFRDRTPYGLERMCIEQVDKYPDLEVWSELVLKAGAVSKWRHRYTEQVKETGVFCHLWIYWKENGR